MPAPMPVLLEHPTAAHASNLAAGIGATSASVAGIDKGADQLVAYLQ